MIQGPGRRATHSLSNCNTPVNNCRNQRQNKLWLFAGESATKHALPKLLNLQREQQMDTFRSPAKPPSEAYQHCDELPGCSEGEIGRLETDQIPFKRKAFSFAGLPVLAQQRFSSFRKQPQTAQNSLITKENHESLNTNKKQFRRKHTSDF